MIVTIAVVLTCIIFYAFGIVFPLDDGNILLYAFSHASLAHLLLNMAGVATFGMLLERALGRLQYVTLVMGSAIAGGVLQMLLGNAHAIGASAILFGLIGATGVLYPQLKVWLVIFPMRARTLMYVSVSIEVLCAVFGWLPGVAHWAHVGGALAGFLLVLI